MRGSGSASTSTRSATPTRAAAVLDLKQHPELEHDEEVWLRFTEDIVRGMGGEGSLPLGRPGDHRPLARVGELRALRGRPARAGPPARAGREDRARLEHEPRPLAFVDHFKLPVDAWVWSGRHGKVKPSPTIFMAVLDELGVAPEAAVMVGDSLEDDVEGRPRARHARLPRRPRGADGGRGRHADPARASGAHRSRDRCLIAPAPGRPARRRGVARDSGARAHVVARPRRLRARVVDHDGGRVPPPVLGEFTHSATLIGLVLAAEGLFAFFMPLFVGPMSDATHLPLGRRRPFMVLALVPMAVSSRCSRSCPLPGDGARPLRLLLRVLHLRAALPRPLPDLVPDNYFGRAQGVQHVLRGTSLGAALVGGGFLLSVWEPFPFILAAGVTLVSCGAVVVLVHEKDVEPTRYERFRSILAAPWRRPPREACAPLPHRQHGLGGDVRGDADLRRPLHHRRLGQPLYVSSTVLGVVAAGYVLAALAAGKFGDEFGVGNVILGASVVYGLGLLVAGFAQTWHWWYYALIAPVAMAGGVVMTPGRSSSRSCRRDRGTITGLATTTKGIGLVIGPLAAGAAIDIFHGYFRSTDGYAVIWPVVAIPVLAVIPLVALLAEADLRGTARRRAS